MAKKVLLVSMPFGELAVPGLGPCLLKPLLVRDGIGCDIRYFGLDLFARYFPKDQAGIRFYRQLLTPSSLFFLGEWAFAAHLFSNVGPPPLPTVSFHPGSKFHGREHDLDEAIQFTLDLRHALPAFLAECFDSIPWSDYALVGFSSCFNQNLGSLALAAAIKARHPGIVTVVGGPNADGPMGSAILRAFPQIDYVFKGEADLTFSQFAQAIVSGRPAPALPGVVGRDSREQPDSSGPLVTDLDALPYPDFDDFRAQVHSTGLASLFGKELPVEASRGCWWGQKHHCTFCGLNRDGMAFRSKSADRLLDELQYLRGRYDTSRFSFTDNILDFRYFKDFLPESIRRGWELDIFFEVKSNITAQKMELLRKAGVTRIQPGIESLSTHVLTLMRKGTSFLQNVECLRNCRTFGVAPIWSHLYGFPGEQLQDYERVLDAIPAIHHLPPPNSLNPVVVQRFAPFFDTPEILGIRNIRPHTAYQAIYPFDDDIVRDLAYFFHDDRVWDREVRAFVLGPLSAAIGEWRASYARGAVLDSVSVGRATIVRDTRTAEARAWILGPFEAAVLRAFERPASPSAAMTALESSAEVDASADAFLDDLFEPLADTGNDELGRSPVLDALRRQGFRCEALGARWSMPFERRFRECVSALRAHRLVLSEGPLLLALPIDRTATVSESRQPRRPQGPIFIPVVEASA
jgi:ribosomal peptide maturation radical SAM protein 1